MWWIQLDGCCAVLHVLPAAFTAKWFAYYMYPGVVAVAAVSLTVGRLLSVLTVTVIGFNRARHFAGKTGAVASGETVVRALVMPGMLWV
jgi:uncharacterized membrane protein (DUF485 family)